MRSAEATKRFSYQPFGYSQLREIYKNGMINKIIRLKTSQALKNGFIFNNEDQEEFYNKNLSKIVKEACKYQLGFGRGVIILASRGANLSTPRVSPLSLANTELQVFDTTECSVLEYGMDMKGERYWKPITYSVRGETIHYTRVIDFTYTQPAFSDRPTYLFRGLAESELIYTQLLNDEIIQKATAGITEKSSSFFYRLKGFKDALRSKKENDIVNFVNLTENSRSVYGAGIIDSEDEVITLSQQINGLRDIDDISLRRISLVTSIPVSMLVGEAVKGLNATGDNERESFNDAIRNYRDDYIVDPVNQLLEALGMDSVEGKDSSDLSPMELAIFEEKVISNANNMALMGLDGYTYLIDKGVIQEDELRQFPEDNVLTDFSEDNEPTV